ncbi:uncharacterized protein LOC118279613 isoform X3 [Spodoptera frugiperda]|uniref:Uncharacterized protein LOC118279613 isoform X3 n=1 Tax=Spodoptera frugiperda TaxID=7108 RepID=A0A9R0E590_SPOFR|nr:uncharacterized protein LOC118279613 isoform X3 [Spodoptera frugiperda]
MVEMKRQNQSVAECGAACRRLVYKYLRMVHFPVRKCYQAAKLVLLVVLVVTILGLFEQWRGGKRNARAEYSDPLEAEYEREILEDEARIVPGLGEGGAAAHLLGEEKKLGEESEKKLAINVYLSDRIPYNRTLRDFRNPACKRVLYDAELPSASVILIFHNEPYSVVVRTIWSVVNSARRSQPWYKHANFIDRQTGRLMAAGYPGQDPTSKFVYLKEIILVDDNSTLPELKGKLSHYVRTRLPPDLIRILRLPDRQGLMLARLKGARAARGDVLVFLDAHCEAGADWLRPLLQRIQHKRDAVITPIIDVIHQTTFEFEAPDTFQVGGFSFMGHFTWTDVPEREKKRRGSDIAPTWSPTMAGGLFAISRTYFWELGAYDEQMGGWGGENLEMSFRIWQCGGTLETIPCSRVGHVFRSFHPYGMPAHTDTHGINTARMAEVWMDEYAELFYLHRPDLRNNPKIGDVTHRKILREKLKCKSFQWYLDNIYKEKFVPVRDVYGYGRFRNAASNMCLDTLQREADAFHLGCYPCHPDLQATQYFSFSLAGELRDEFNCAVVKMTRESEGEDASRPVVMTACKAGERSQRWRRLAGGRLQHAASGLCLAAPRDIADVRAAPCAPADPSQAWAIDYTEDNNFHANDLRFGAEREKRLNRLRGQRRISRSLLSYSDTNSNLLEDARREDGGNATIRRHSHKGKHHKRHGRKRSRSKKRTKNKFILKIARTLMNGTEEHLEVDIHCKHRQLFPNNTFVRDLVTILNERNVKVINNGRVFERNKVTELEQQAQKVLNKLDIEPPPTPAPPQPPAPRHQPGPRIRGPEVGMAQMREGVKQRIKKTKQSPAVQSVITQEPVNDALAQIEGLSALGGPPRIDLPPRHTPHKAKKIIIEDFVEVKRLTPSPAPLQGEKGGQPQRTRKRKRKRNHSTTAYPPPAPPPPAPAPPSPPPAVVPLVAPHELLRERLDDSHSDSHSSSDRDREDSAEDTTQGDSMDRSAGLEDWTIGESRFRRNNSRVRPLRRNDIDSQSVERAAPREPRPAPRAPAPQDPRPRDPDTDYMRRSDTTDEPQYQSAAPVKVVMRSNLTFNLGDEFFAWRTRATDDLVSEFLGELAIPPTNATSGEASTARADPTSGQHSDSSSDSSGD